MQKVFQYTYRTDSSIPSSFLCTPTLIPNAVSSAKTSQNKETLFTINISFDELGMAREAEGREPSFDWEYVYLGKIGFGWPIKNEQTFFLFFSSCSSSFSGEINIKSGFLWYPECIKRKRQRVGIGFGLLCWLLHQAAIYNDFGDQRLEVMPSPHLARHQAQQDLSTEIENFSTANTPTRN